MNTNTETPPPRLVPDRPSDAAIAQAFWEYHATATPFKEPHHGLIVERACFIDAAAPPAEAPAERGEATVLDVGFKYENGVHTPTVLVGFKPDDWAARDRFAANVNTLAAAPAGEGPKLHIATRQLVDAFAVALAEKLAAAEAKYGYSDNWRDPNWMDECRAKLLEHVAKGDPRDVAAYCAFLWFHGASTAAPAAPAEGDWLPKDNDGKEQDAFEAWATGEGLDMHQHPLHWLFLNERTNAARKGWRGALAYVKAQAEANTTPRVTGGREVSALPAKWRGITTNRDIEWSARKFMEGYDKALSDCASDLEKALQAATGGAGGSDGL